MPTDNAVAKPTVAPEYWRSHAAGKHHYFIRFGDHEIVATTNDQEAADAIIEQCNGYFKLIAERAELANDVERLKNDIVTLDNTQAQIADALRWAFARVDTSYLSGAQLTRYTEINALLSRIGGGK